MITEQQINFDNYFKRNYFKTPKDVLTYYIRAVIGGTIGCIGILTDNFLFKGSGILISPFGTPFSSFIYSLYKTMLVT